MSVCLRVWLSAGSSVVDVYAWTPALLDLIMFGALAALVAGEPVVKNCVAWATRLRVPEIVVAVMLVWLVKIDEKFFAQHSGLAMPMAFGFALLVLCVALEPGKTPLMRLLESKAFQWIGRRSYGIYLYHFPIMWALEGLRIQGNLWNMLWVSSLRIAASVAVAEISYRFIETPFLKMKARFSGSKTNREMLVGNH